MIMPRSSLALDSVPRRSDIALLRSVESSPPGIIPAISRIRLRLSVDSTKTFVVRQSLHLALGDGAAVHVVDVDHRHNEMTLHVEVALPDRYTAMDAIMSALPSAEFGAMTTLGEDHVAH